MPHQWGAVRSSDNLSSTAARSATGHIKKAHARATAHIPSRLHRTWVVVRVPGTKASYVPKKAYLECVFAPQPARAAGTHRSRAFCTLGGQSVSRLDAVLEMESCHRLAAGRVPAHRRRQLGGVVECEA